MDETLRLPQHPRLGAFAGACILAVPGLYCVVFSYRLPALAFFALSGLVLFKNATYWELDRRSGSIAEIRSGPLSTPRELRRWDTTGAKEVLLTHFPARGAGVDNAAHYTVQIFLAQGLPLPVPCRRAAARRIAEYLNVPLEEKTKTWTDADTAQARAMGRAVFETARMALSKGKPEQMKAHALAALHAEIAAFPESGLYQEQLAQALMQGTPDPGPALQALRRAQEIYQDQDRAADAAQAAAAAQELEQYMAQGGASGTPLPAALDHLARCRQLLDARVRSQAATIRDDIAAMESQRPI
ncbi:MAG TPA: hypothetical protein VOA80_11850 [Thermoanaerobaculia bacterium]|nr:hypothetical protein [Thermoanaerobaculia bacterium]